MRALYLASLLCASVASQTQAEQAWAPCRNDERPCCNPRTSPPQFCPGDVACQECGGSSACECQSGPSPPTPTPILLAPAPPTPLATGEKSLEIFNSCQEHLHVFLQLNNANERWTQVGGNGQVYPPITWGPPEAAAWDPLGAKIASEAIIPPGKNIVLRMPELDPPQFVVMAVKMNEMDKNTPLQATKASDFVNGVPKEVVPGQQAVLIEAGKEAVADASAVDGINYKIKYELTTGGGKVETTEITTDPCEGLDAKYQRKVGCQNPAKVDCNGEPSCDCKKGTQDCMFNECSQTLFDIPDNLKKYIGTYDGGDANGKPVKTFINDPKNLKVGSALAKFCAAVNGVGDFTTYCYDYNDVSSSPWLRSPYKIKVTFSELQSDRDLEALIV